MRSRLCEYETETSNTKTSQRLSKSILNDNNREERLRKNIVEKIYTFLLIVNKYFCYLKTSFVIIYQQSEFKVNMKINNNQLFTLI